jgi:hypothetical protein
VEGTCSIFLGSCDIIKYCDKNCKDLHPDGKGTCYYNNMCTCFFDYGPPKNPSEDLRMCQIGLDKCTYECDESCCNSKCAKNFKDGAGNCIDNNDTKLCICHYSPQN